MKSTDHRCIQYNFDAYELSWIVGGRPGYRCTDTRGAIRFCTKWQIQPEVR